MLSMAAEAGGGAGYGLVWRTDDGPRPTLSGRRPVVVEFASGPQLAARRITSGYQDVSVSGEDLVGVATVEVDGTRVRVSDTWRRLSDDEWAVDRQATVLTTGAAEAGYRLLL